MFIESQAICDLCNTQIHVDVMHKVTYTILYDSSEYSMSCVSVATQLKLSAWTGFELVFAPFEFYAFNVILINTTQQSLQAITKSA